LTAIAYSWLARCFGLVFLFLKLGCRLSIMGQEGTSWL